MKEKQNLASEKPKLEIAQRLRGIYFIEPEDEEVKEIIKNARISCKYSSSSCCALQKDEGWKLWDDM